MTDKARILFVDDEKRVLNSMRGMFRREYELFLATEGTEAVRIACENEIDVIVADQRMPGMSGIEVLAKIKEQSPRTVRILLTGYADPSAVEGSINIGEVFRFLSKPCPPKMLRETLILAITAARTRPDTSSASSPPPETATSGQPELVTLSQPEQETSPSPLPATAPEPAPIVQENSGLEPLHDDDDTQPALPTLDESAMVSTGGHPTSHWQSVTNVVMSEDTIEETQENVVPTSSALGVNDIGVVVFTVDSEFAATAIRAVSTERNTTVATTLVKVVHVIEEGNTGVLVTDFTTNKTILQKIIGALKQYMPELVTIVVSDGRDTTDMINLINYGQVFRYVLKPIEPTKLRSDINAAVIRHLYLLNNPESVKRHQVIDATDTGKSSTTINRFLGRIRKLQSLRTDPTDTIT